MPAQEYIFDRFDGGINPSQAADKLLEWEALQAQNVRLDDFGNLASAFPSSAQSTGLTDTASNKNVHSLFYSPSIGAMAVAPRRVEAPMPRPVSCWS